MITVTSLSKAFDRVTLFRELSFTLAPGIYCISGPSGCGKTTLGRILCGLETADSGSVAGIVGRPTVLFQEPRLLPSVSALHNVASISRSRDGLEGARRHLLALQFTEDDLTKTPAELSGGMQQRVAIARALLFAEENPGNLALLDEPFRGLDPDTKAVAAAKIRESLSDRITVVITHDAADAPLLGATALSFDTIRNGICPN